MKKLVSVLIGGLAVFIGILSLAGCDFDRGRAHHFTPPHRGHGNYSRAQGHIWKEIHKNERRILKLEAQIQNLRRKQQHHGEYHQRERYSREIYQKEREIDQLRRRNQHLKEMLRP